MYQPLFKPFNRSETIPKRIPKVELIKVSRVLKYFFFEICNMKREFVLGLRVKRKQFQRDHNK